MKSIVEVAEANKERFTQVEERLANILRPIKPRQEFVKGLRQRIDVLHKPSVVTHLTLAQLILVVLGGVLSVAVLMVMGTRALLSLFAWLGVIEATGRKKPAQIPENY